MTISKFKRSLNAVLPGGVRASGVTDCIPRQGFRRNRLHSSGCMYTGIILTQVSSSEHLEVHRHSGNQFAVAAALDAIQEIEQTSEPWTKLFAQDPRRLEWDSWMVQLKDTFRLRQSHLLIDILESSNVERFSSYNALANAEPGHGDWRRSSRGSEPEGLGARDPCAAEDVTITIVMMLMSTMVAMMGCEDDSGANGRQLQQH